jgi:hypothetical protein
VLPGKSPDPASKAAGRSGSADLVTANERAPDGQHELAPSERAIQATTRRKKGKLQTELAVTPQLAELATGTRDIDLGEMLISQTTGSTWVPSSDPDRHETWARGTVGALQGIEPADAIEGMIAAQMTATHNAAMECFRRAHLREQSFEGRQAALSQAGKLVRSFAMLVDSLNRHRGKGRQVVRVEHVTVEAGGQAIVGAIGGGEGGGKGNRG